MTEALKNGFITPDWPAPATVKAYSTLRQSGVCVPNSSGSYSPQDFDQVLLKQLLQLPSDPIWLKQTHSTLAVNATPANRQQEADATFTDKPNTICVVQTADCLPILLCHRQGTHVAAIHAGWRGLAQGIIENTLQQFNQAPEDILAWLGPAIGPSKFEVRKDVYAAFTQTNPAAATAFQQTNEDQWLANLYTLARQRLQDWGITAVFGGQYCTYSDPERFFSYRRDGKTTGRLIHLIWIDADQNKSA